MGIHKSIKSHNSESGQCEFEMILIRMTKKKWPCKQTHCLLSVVVLLEYYSLLFSPCNAFFTEPVQRGPLSPLLWLNGRQTFFWGGSQKFSPFRDGRGVSSGGKSMVVQTEWACEMRWWLLLKITSRRSSPPPSCLPDSLPQFTNVLQNLMWSIW